MKTVMLMTMMLYSCTALAQLSRLEEVVTLKAENTPLEEIIAMIQREYNIRFSHGHFRGLQKRVSVSVKDAPLKEFLRLALDEAGLYYKTINVAVVLREKDVALGKSGTEGKPDGAMLRITRESMMEEDSAYYPQESMTDSSVTGQGVDMGTQHYPDRDSTRGIVYCTYDTALKADGNRREESVTKNRKVLPLYAWAGYSFDFNRYTFAPPSVPFFRYNSEREWGVQAGILFHPFPRIITFVGAGYVTKSFSMEYNYEMIDNDPMAVPERTTVNVSYAEVPVQAGYEFFRYRTFSAYVTGGVHATFRIDHHEQTTYQNAVPADTKTFLESNTKFLLGGSAGLMLRQAIGKRWAVLVQPVYVWYNEPVNTEAMATATKLVRINTTLELRMKK